MIHLTDIMLVPVGRQQLSAYIYAYCVVCRSEIKKIVWFPVTGTENSVSIYHDRHCEIIIVVTGYVTKLIYLECVLHIVPSQSDNLICTMWSCFKLLGFIWFKPFGSCNIVSLPVKKYHPQSSQRTSNDVLTNPSELQSLMYVPRLQSTQSKHLNHTVCT